MIPAQGFACAWLGRRTRSFGSGGRRGAAALVVLGGISYDLVPLAPAKLRIGVIEGAFSRVWMRWIMGAGNRSC